MRRERIAWISLLVVFALASCTALGITSKPWAERTPKEKALAILETYNSQYQNTMAMALRKDLTEAQKKVVRNKKETLKQLYPLVGLYLSIVEAGGTPSKMQEQEILNLIDLLGGKV